LRFRRSWILQSCAKTSTSAQQAHPRCASPDTKKRRGLSRLEPQEVHEHQHLAIDRFERPESGFQVEAGVLIGQLGRNLDIWRVAALEETVSGGFEQDPVRNAEQPRRDACLTPESRDGGAGSHERLLREFLCVVLISDGAKEVGVHRLLVSPEHIFDLHDGFILIPAE
jgi:hypothetical protein